LRYVAALRAAVWAVERNQPVADVQLLQDLVDRELSTQRVQLWLLGAFAGLALLLASIGLYGLLPHMVMQRTRDIGVRIALGARGAQVLAQVMGEGLSLVGCGLMAGVMASWWTTRLMQKLLYGVKPTDLATFAVVAGALLLAGAAACYIPARVLRVSTRWKRCASNTGDGHGNRLLTRAAPIRAATVTERPSRNTRPYY
jgi:hypothetical protein